jgi:predicted chitinase
MKKLVLAIIALSALAFNASAQTTVATFKPVTLLTIDTLAAAITNSATSNYTATVSVRGANKIGIGIKNQYNGAGSTANIYKFAKSADGVNFETTPSILVTNTPNGSTATYYFTEATVSGCAAVQLTQIVNGSAAAITNAFVKIFPTP